MTNIIYMQTLKIDEVPWRRLTTAYGRASEFPKYFKIISDMSDCTAVKDALNEITDNIEHQETLWHSTPFAMIFLVRIFEKAVSEINKNETANFLIEKLLIFFTLVAQCFHYGNDMEHEQQLPLFSDMLKEEYLWSKEYNEEDDENRYFEGDVFPDDLFYSFYYYSYQTLLYCKPVLKKLEGTTFGEMVGELNELL